MVPDPVPTAQSGVDFRRVYEAEVERVYYRLQRLGVPERDLEDKVHDVFVLVHRRLADYDPSRPIGPWIAGFTVRVAADHRKRVSRKRELMQEDVGAVSQAPDPEKALQARQQHEVLIMLLDRLDPDRREVVVLHDLEGHSMPEIAELLGVGLNTLYSRLRLGREQLARDLRRARIKDMAR